MQPGKQVIVTCPVAGAGVVGRSAIELGNVEGQVVLVGRD
jgi:hypothetical protein